MKEKHFNDVMEIYDFIKDTPKNNYSRSYSAYSHGLCAFTWEQTVDSMLNGWPEGAKDILDLSDQINARLDDTEGSYSLEYGTTGEYIDMGRYVTGEPECCGTVITGTVARPVVNITVNIACLGNVSTEAIPLFIRRLP